MTTIFTTIPMLDKRLSLLQEARLQVELSDDRCLTNGRLRRIDMEIDAVKAQLQALKVAREEV